jgi:hypothetical protein
MMKCSSSPFLSKTEMVNFDFGLAFAYLCENTNFRYCRLMDIIENHGCNALQMGQTNVVYDLPYFILSLVMAFFCCGLYWSIRPNDMVYKGQQETRGTLYCRVHLFLVGLSVFFGGVSVSLTAFDGPAQHTFMVFKGALLNMGQVLLIWITLVDLHIVPVQTSFRWKFTKGISGSMEFVRCDSPHGAIDTWRENQAQAQEATRRGKTTEKKKTAFCLPGPPILDLIDVVAFVIPMIVGFCWFAELNNPTTQGIITHSLVIPIMAAFIHVFCMIPVFIIRQLYLGVIFVIFTDGFMITALLLELYLNEPVCKGTSGVLSGATVAVLMFALYRVFFQLTFSVLKFEGKEGARGEVWDGLPPKPKKLAEASSSEAYRPMAIEFSDYEYSYTYTASEDDV